MSIYRCEFIDFGQNLETVLNGKYYAMKLIKNSILNIGGIVIPMLVAIPSMGFVARMLGIERFGIFTIFFTIIGYAGVFDVGISRAVIRMIALSRHNKTKMKEIINTALVAMFFLSIIAAVLIFINSGLIIDLLKVSMENRLDSVLSLCLLSIGIMPLMLTQVLNSYLEGVEEFRSINIQKIVATIIMSVLPLLLLLISNKLSMATLGVVIARYIALFIAYLSVNNLFFKFVRPSLETFKELISFGGWLTVSNIISPIMVNFDRFILANYVNASAIAIYTIPSELVNKMRFIPNAVSRALFPILSASKNDGEREREKKHAELILLLMTAIICLPIFIFSENILTLWVGDGYKGEPSFILKILILGFFFNSLAQIPFSNIQAKGYANKTAIIHLCEVIPYLILLSYLVNMYGVKGVAIAWTARVIVDYVLLLLMDRSIFSMKNS